MYKSHQVNSLQQLQLQLEESIQMLRLVAAEKRTCLEVDEWLQINYPQNISDSDILSSLLHQGALDKNDRK
jgi:hypothetical protein